MFFFRNNRQTSKENIFCTENPTYVKNYKSIAFKIFQKENHKQYSMFFKNKLSYRHTYVIIRTTNPNMPYYAQFVIKFNTHNRLK